MTLHIFGDSWGTPWKIKEKHHFLHRDKDYINHSKAGISISNIRYIFFIVKNQIRPTDSIFFVIPPDIRFFAPDMRTYSVIQKEWQRTFKYYDTTQLDDYFSSVIFCEIILLQTIAKRVVGDNYWMWHNYGSLDFQHPLYGSEIDHDRFVSYTSMMDHLLGYSTKLEPRQDGPDVQLTNTSRYFLKDDQHPSVKGHNKLHKIYSEFCKDKFFATVLTK